MPGFEPGISQPQCEVLTTILHTPGEAGYRSQYLSHAKRALYHLSYIPNGDCSPRLCLQMSATLDTTTPPYSPCHETPLLQFSLLSDHCSPYYSLFCLTPTQCHLSVSYRKYNITAPILELELISIQSWHMIDAQYKRRKRFAAQRELLLHVDQRQGLSR